MSSVSVHPRNWVRLSSFCRLHWRWSMPTHRGPNQMPIEEMRLQSLWFIVYPVATVSPGCFIYSFKQGKNGHLLVMIIPIALCLKRHFCHHSLLCKVKETSCLSWGHLDGSKPVSFHGANAGRGPLVPLQTLCCFFSVVPHFSFLGGFSVAASLFRLVIGTHFGLIC